MKRRPGRHLGALVVIAALAFALSAASEGTVSGPTVTLDKVRIRPDERVAVTVDGFESLNVTISVCGNEARRGSSDCNMFASEGLKLDTDGTSTLVAIPVAVPPEPCPCVIRVSSRLNDEIATTPIEIIGHPSAPVVDSVSPVRPLIVSIEAEAAPPGVFERARASAGGPLLYRVTVRVRNASTAPFRQVALSGTAVRGNDQLATLPFDDVGEIKPGQTWEQTVTAEVPGPSLGVVEWRVAASGAGPTVTAADTTRQRPILLIVLVSLLVVDVFVIAIRFVMRRRARRETADPVTTMEPVAAVEPVAASAT